MHDEASSQFWIKVGGLLGHSPARPGDLGDRLNGGWIQQKGHAANSFPHSGKGGFGIGREFYYGLLFGNPKSVP